MSEITVVLTRAEVLQCIREDLDRAYHDAERRLADDEYHVHNGLNTAVTIRAASGDGQKISRFHKVGDAVNHRAWRGVDA